MRAGDRGEFQEEVVVPDQHGAREVQTLWRRFTGLLFFLLLLLSSGRMRSPNMVRRPDMYVQYVCLVYVAHGQ